MVMKLDDMVLISVDDHVVEPPGCLDAAAVMDG